MLVNMSLINNFSIIVATLFRLDLSTINYAIIVTFKDRLPNYFKKIYLFIILISYKVIRLIYAHTV